MGLFGKKKNKKSLFDKPTRHSKTHGVPLLSFLRPRGVAHIATNRFEVKKKRRVFGKTVIAETSNPYNNKPTFLSRFRRKKRLRKSNPNLIAPPARLSQNKPSRLRKILLALLILFIVGGTIYFSFFTDYFEISQFEIFEDGTQITNNLKLNDIATKNLFNQNLILFNDGVLTAEILQQNPEYKTVTVKKIFPKDIQIALEKYPVAANIVDLIQGQDSLTIQKKYLVNTNGMIIMENDENPELPYITINTEQAYNLNDFPLDQQKLDYIIKLTNLFEEKFGIKVIEAEYLKKAREVHLRTEKGFTVWFDMTKDMLPQIDKLKKALPKLDIYKTPLQYIDLRITSANAEKVIFKRR